MSEVRARESKLMFWNAVIKTINITMVFGVPPLVTFSVLVPYELTNYSDNKVYIKPQTAFTMLSLFNVLRFPLVVLPKALRCVSEALNATKNLERFLAEKAAPRHDTTGKPGVSFSKVVWLGGSGAGSPGVCRWLGGGLVVGGGGQACRYAQCCQPDWSAATCSWGPCASQQLQACTP